MLGILDCFSVEMNCERNLVFNLVTCGTSERIKTCFRKLTTYSRRSRSLSSVSKHRAFVVLEKLLRRKLGASAVETFEFIEILLTQEEKHLVIFLAILHWPLKKQLKVGSKCSNKR